MSVDVVLGSSTNYGELVSVRREKSYAGKSTITGKTLHRIHYAAYFYNSNNKTVGNLGDNKPFTTWLQTKSITELRQHLKDHGYT